ncbi:hypothetical protein BDN72DRAFT_903674 [Pluteus cervinus]|uniref:Uncharacterized protein n=1 Tax=Pluteus cervinus TaxID=181527 RepID=A0ACD3A8P8_9AGAR|nr:hypothetical protein BDN72DRAFT_903674 [Pluteus cervinus]
MDGQVAAVIPDDPQFNLPQPSFITSPNQPMIPFPPLGLRSVVKRADWLFGDDDYCQWPQPFSRLHPHHACIPRSFTQAQDMCMWDKPLDSYFVHVSSSVPDHGRLKPNHISSLHESSAPILTRAATYQSRPDIDEKVAKLMASLVQLLQHSLSRLSHIPTSFDEMALIFRHLQRTWKELVALLDYTETFKPQMDKPDPSFQSREVAPTIGAFVWDRDDALHLFNACIPFWFIQPRELLSDHNILHVVPLTEPDRVIEMRTLSRFPVFKGDAGDPRKVQALQSEGAKRLSSLNPFSSGDRPHRATTSSGPRSSRSASPPWKISSSSGRSSRQAKQVTDVKSEQFIFSYLHTASNSSIPVRPDDFKPPTAHNFLPDSIPIWRDALSAVDTQARNLVPRHRRSDDDFKTMFPEPKLFTGSCTPERAARCLATWAEIQSACIYRVTIQETSPSLLGKQDWRDLLFTARNAKTKTLLQIFEEPFRACQVHYEDKAAQPPPPLPDITNIRQILWEFYELNFRWDLCALDEQVRLRSVNSALHHDRLQNALNTPGLFTLFDSTYASGLASPIPQERKLVLLRLRTVIKDWEGMRAPILNHVGDDYSDTEIRSLETAIAKHVCQTFFNYFGRPISIPHCILPS